jgi:hypothetical protein
VWVQAVAFAQRGRFFIEPERSAAHGGIEHVESPLIMSAHGFDGRNGGTANLAIDIGQQSRAIGQSIDADFGGAFKVAHSIVVATGIGIDRQGIESRAQPAAKLSVTLLDEPGHVVFEFGAQRHEGGQRIASAPEPREHRADAGPIVAEIAANRRRLAGQ